MSVPTGAPVAYPVSHVICRYGMIRGEYIFVDDLAVVVGGGEFTPVYPACIVSVAQRHLLNPAISIGESALAFVALYLVGVNTSSYLQPIHVFI